MQPAPVPRIAPVASALALDQPDARLARVIEQLSDSDQTLLAMTYRRRLSPRLAARELGCSEVAVRTQLTSALLQVATLLLQTQEPAPDGPRKPW